MGHLTSKDAYLNLEDRLNWFTQGAGRNGGIDTQLQQAGLLLPISPKVPN